MYKRSICICKQAIRMYKRSVCMSIRPSAAAATGRVGGRGRGDRNRNDTINYQAHSYATARHEHLPRECMQMPFA